MRQYEAYTGVDSTRNRPTRDQGRQFGFKTGSIVGAG